MAADDLVLAMTGASGAPYGVRLLEVLVRAGRTVHLVLSPAAVEVLEVELDRKVAIENFERLWAQETGNAPLIGDLKLVKGQGCALCNGTGYVGRIGVVELLVLTDELRQLILERATHHIYRGALSGAKLRTMLVDGLEKAAQGMTTLEEVLRVMDESEMEDIAG